MARRVSIKPQQMAPPQWVFNWLPLRQSSFPTAFAILTVGGGCAFCLTSVRIRVDPPTPWATHKVSIIQISNDADGRALSLQAREGGPFPSRFEPSEWEGASTIEQTAFQVARGAAPPYVPVLRNLPTEKIPPVTLAAKGESTLPKLTSEILAAPLSAVLKLAPVLYPLSGITLAAMPHTLPPFDDAVKATMTAEPWRFLVQLNSAGKVQDCVSLGGDDESGPSPLVAWLRRVQFPPEPAKPTRWIAVGVGFTNQPADGPDTR